MNFSQFLQINTNNLSEAFFQISVQKKFNSFLRIYRHCFYFQLYIKIYKREKIPSEKLYVPNIFSTWRTKKTIF